MIKCHDKIVMPPDIGQYCSQEKMIITNKFIPQKTRLTNNVNNKQKQSMIESNKAKHT
jgi:hypothetical protein